MQKCLFHYKLHVLKVYTQYCCAFHHKFCLLIGICILIGSTCRNVYFCMKLHFLCEGLYFSKVDRQHHCVFHHITRFLGWDLYFSSVDMQLPGIFHYKDFFLV